MLDGFRIVSDRFGLPPFVEASPLDRTADAGVQLIRDLARQSICECGTGCQTDKAPVAPVGVKNTAIEGVVQLVDDMEK